MYTEKIRALESRLKTLESRIESHIKNPEHDLQLLRELRDQKQNTLNELRRLNRLEYEDSYERVRFEDDR